MKQVRAVERILPAYATVEGAGVRLHRAFGYYEVPQFDPFLMLDDFRSPRPEDYLAGFPDHPHRGIETVTYMIEGEIEHGDSLGHRGTVGPGAVQWMTAGSGIIHHEMPRPVNGRMGGFQLWVNLPASSKMMTPRYQEVPAEEIPTVTPRNDVSIRVICGTVNGITGPVRHIIASPRFLDISLAPDTFFTLPVPDGHTAIAYITGGEGTFDAGEGHRVENRDLVLFSRGSSIWTRSFGKGMRFLLISGKPTGEPVAWRGPIVMNTREELRQAFLEYRNGTFIKTTAE